MYYANNEQTIEDSNLKKLNAYFFQNHCKLQKYFLQFKSEEQSTFMDLFFFLILNR